MTTAVREEHGQPVPDTPARGFRRTLLPLGLFVAGLGLAAITQLVFDPFRTDIPLCVVYHLTGLYCPGCGATRSVHALLDGDLSLALRNNALIILALPAVAGGFVMWTVRRAQGRSMNLHLSNRVLYVLLAVVALFTMLRNLPAFWIIAPISFVGA